MNDFATLVYVMSDDLLRTLNINDNPQSQMTNAEVITIAILSGKYFYKNLLFHISLQYELFIWDDTQLKLL